jgi:hypothetical protein
MWCHGLDIPVMDVVEYIGNSNPDQVEDVVIIVPCTSGVL